jgi:hypothetical protein
VVPFTQDEALLHLELWGFASTMVLAVSGRVFPRFLLLQPTREWLLRPALGLWAFGSFGVPLVWLFMDGAAPARLVVTLAQLAGAVLYVLSLRLYEWPSRESGTPRVTHPTRRWARSAFALLLTAAAANVGIAAAETLGLPVTLTEISAGRHLVAQGFLLPLIVVMAARASCRATRGGCSTGHGCSPYWCGRSWSARQSAAGLSLWRGTRPAGAVPSHWVACSAPRRSSCSRWDSGAPCRGCRRSGLHRTRLLARRVALKLPEERSQMTTVLASSRIGLVCGSVDAATSCRRLAADNPDPLVIIVYQPTSGVSMQMMTSVLSDSGDVTNVSGVGDKAIVGEIELDAQAGKQLIAIQGGGGNLAGDYSKAVAVAKAVIAALP